MTSLKQIYENILFQKFTWLKVLDSQGDTVAILRDSSDKKVKPEEVVSFVKQFVKNSPGIYDFHFKKFATHSANTTIKYKKVNCHTETAQVIHDAFNEELERERIRKEVIEEERQKKIKADYEAEILKLNTAYGKMEWLAMRIYEKFIAPPVSQPPLNGNLNGTNSNTKMGHEPIPLDQLTQEQKIKADQAYLMLLQIVNPETLHAVATGLKNDPAKLQMLISFVTK